MVICKTGIFLRLKFRRNPNDFLECRSLALQRTAFAEESSISVLLHRQLPRLVRRGEAFQSVGKDGVITSAHPFNHHFQGRGVKTHMGNDFPGSGQQWPLFIFDSRACRCHLLALFAVIFVKNEEAIWYQYFI